MIWKHFDQLMCMSLFIETKPLQDLTNARTLSLPSSEEVSGRLIRRKREPTCYAEPKLNRLGFKLFLPMTFLVLQNPALLSYACSPGLDPLSLCLSSVPLTLHVSVSPSATVWLSRNSALVSMHVQASGNKLSKNNFPHQTKTSLSRLCMW